MKRILALCLAGALILALAACGEAPKVEDTPVLDEELERAVSYGLVSAEELSGLEETVTYSQFCGLLSKVVAMRGEDFVPAWEDLAAAALASDEPMQRDDVLLAMFEASIVMEIDRDESLMED